jgi:hypothetical protein
MAEQAERYDDMASAMKQVDIILHNVQCSSLGRMAKCDSNSYQFVTKVIYYYIIH